MKTVLITGANRGLGLGMAKEALSRGYKVLVTCRDPENASELKEMHGRLQGQLVILRLEVTSDDSIKELLTSLESIVDSIDILINNAGVNSVTLSPESPKKLRNLMSLDRNLILKMFDINTVSPIILAKNLLRFLKKSENPLIVNISSFRASFGDIEEEPDYAYTSSKVALNMMTRELSMELNPENINCFAIDPGWVKTPMTKGEGDYTPEESAQTIFNTIENFNSKNNGKFLNTNGSLAQI